MTRAQTNGPATIDAYIAEFPEDIQVKLAKIRGVIAKAAPGADESISYRIPTFKTAGRPLLYFAAFKAHIGLYPITASAKEAFKKELTGYAQSKGTIRFPLEEQVPYALIGKIAKFRLKENAEAAKGKGGKTTIPKKSKKQF